MYISYYLHLEFRIRKEVKITLILHVIVDLLLDFISFYQNSSIVLTYSLPINDLCFLIFAVYYQMFNKVSNNYCYKVTQSMLQKLLK